MSDFVDIGTFPVVVRHRLVPERGFSYGFFGDLGDGSSTAMQLDENVQRQAIAENMGIKAENMCFMAQLHSGEVAAIDATGQYNKQVDGLVTNVRGLALCVKSADCVPVIFIDQSRGIAGVAHAGWKSLFADIVGKVVRSMQSLGANRDNILVVIGPCIRKQSYEVGEEFFDQWVKQYPESEDFFSEYSIVDDKRKFKFDLAGIASAFLIQSGIKSIYDCCIDTYTSDKFFSYRRNVQLGNNWYNPNISVILLK